jgi:hypothetical protein
MINAIHLSSLRNAEYLQFQKDILGIVGRNSPATLNVQQRFDTTHSKLTEMESLFKKVMASEITADLLALDERRDKAITGISQVVMGYTYHYDEALRKAAEHLDINIKLYGTAIARMNYQAETTTITALLNDWNTKPELTNAAATLGLGNWKEELENANHLFNSRYLDRTQEMGAANPDSLKSKRGEMNEAYYGLRDRIDALHTLADAEPSAYTLVIGQLNALIEQYNNLIAGRGNNTAPPDVPPADEPEQPQQDS